MRGNLATLGLLITLVPPSLSPLPFLLPLAPFSTTQTTLPPTCCYLSTLERQVQEPPLPPWPFPSPPSPLVPNTTV